MRVSEADLQGDVFLTFAVENWVNLLLPARSFGKIILTTSAGIMDHEEARRKHVSEKRRCRISS